VTSAKPMNTTVGGAAIDRLDADLHNRVGPWLRTREGVASVSISVVVFLWAAMVAPLPTAVLGAALAMILVSLAARLWESRTAPRAAAFCQVEHPVHGCLELQEDPNAGFRRDSRGFLWGHRIWFAGTGCPPRQLRPETYLRLRAWHNEGDLPAFVARSGQRQWWWWRNAFYWESGDCGPQDAVALLMMLERDDEQGIEWEVEAHLAEPIPEHVKRHVYNRDGGRCLACGSDELIQYGRVIPWSMGGGNEPQNIGVLCAGCSRRRAIGLQDSSHAASALA
jgi:hypothetical protein